MKPFTRTWNMEEANKVFNYRLSSARQVVERAYGTLVEKWQIFGSNIKYKLENTDRLILALMSLNNFLITTEMQMPESFRRYRMANDPATMYEPNVSVENLQEDLGGVMVRNRLRRYFVSPAGAIDIQWQRI